MGSWLLSGRAVAQTPDLSETLRYRDSLFVWEDSFARYPLLDSLTVPEDSLFDKTDILLTAEPINPENWKRVEIDAGSLQKEVILEPLADFSGIDSIRVVSLSPSSVELDRDTLVVRVYDAVEFTPQQINLTWGDSLQPPFDLRNWLSGATASVRAGVTFEKTSADFDTVEVRNGTTLHITTDAYRFDVLTAMVTVVAVDPRRSDPSYRQPAPIQSGTISVRLTPTTANPPFPNTFRYRDSLYVWEDASTSVNLLDSLTAPDGVPKADLLLTTEVVSGNWTLVTVYSDSLWKPLRLEPAPNYAGVGRILVRTETAGGYELDRDTLVVRVYDAVEFTPQQINLTWGDSLQPPFDLRNWLSGATASVRAGVTFEKTSTDFDGVHVEVRNGTTLHITTDAYRFDVLTATVTVAIIDPRRSDPSYRQPAPIQSGTISVHLTPTTADPPFPNTFRYRDTVRVWEDVPTSVYLLDSLEAPNGVGNGDLQLIAEPLSGSWTLVTIRSDSLLLVPAPDSAGVAQIRILTKDPSGRELDRDVIVVNVRDRVEFDPKTVVVQWGSTASALLTSWLSGTTSAIRAAIMFRDSTNAPFGVTISIEGGVRLVVNATGGFRETIYDTVTVRIIDPRGAPDDVGEIPLRIERVPNSPPQPRLDGKLTFIAGRIEYVRWLQEVFTDDWDKFKLRFDLPVGDPAYVTLRNDSLIITPAHLDSGQVIPICIMATDLDGADTTVCCDVNILQLPTLLLKQVKLTGVERCSLWVTLSDFVIPSGTPLVWDDQGPIGPIKVIGYEGNYAGSPETRVLLYVPDLPDSTDTSASVPMKATYRPDFLDSTLILRDTISVRVRSEEGSPPRFKDSIPRVILPFGVLKSMRLDSLTVAGFVLQPHWDVILTPSDLIDTTLDQSSSRFTMRATKAESRGRTINVEVTVHDRTLRPLVESATATANFDVYVAPEPDTSVGFVFVIADTIDVYEDSTEVIDLNTSVVMSTGSPEQLIWLDPAISDSNITVHIDPAERLLTVKPAPDYVTHSSILPILTLRAQLPGRKVGMKEVSVRIRPVHDIHIPWQTLLEGQAIEVPLDRNTTQLPTDRHLTWGWVVKAGLLDVVRIDSNTTGDAQMVIRPIHPIFPRDVPFVDGTVTDSVRVYAWVKDEYGAVITDSAWLRATITNLPNSPPEFKVPAPVILYQGDSHVIFVDSLLVGGAPRQPHWWEPVPSPGAPFTIEWDSTAPPRLTIISTLDGALGTGTVQLRVEQWSEIRDAHHALDSTTLTVRVERRLHPEDYFRFNVPKSVTIIEDSVRLLSMYDLGHYINGDSAKVRSLRVDCPEYIALTRNADTLSLRPAPNYNDTLGTCYLIIEFLTPDTTDVVIKESQLFVSSRLDIVASPVGYWVDEGLPLRIPLRVTDPPKDRIVWSVNPKSSRKFEVVRYTRTDSMNWVLTVRSVSDSIGLDSIRVTAADLSYEPPLTDTKWLHVTARDLPNTPPVFRDDLPDSLPFNSDETLVVYLDTLLVGGRPDRGHWVIEADTGLVVEPADSSWNAGKGFIAYAIDSTAIAHIRLKRRDAIYSRSIKVTVTDRWKVEDARQETASMWLKVAPRQRPHVNRPPWLTPPPPGVLTMLEDAVGEWLLADLADDDMTLDDSLKWTAYPTSDSANVHAKIDSTRRMLVVTAAEDYFTFTCPETTYVEIPVSIMDMDGASSGILSLFLWIEPVPDLRIRPDTLTINPGRDTCISVEREGWIDWPTPHILPRWESIFIDAVQKPGEPPVIWTRYDPPTRSLCFEPESGMPVGIQTFFVRLHDLITDSFDHDTLVVDFGPRIADSPHFFDLPTQYAYEHDTLRIPKKKLVYDRYQLPDLINIEPIDLPCKLWVDGLNSPYVTIVPKDPEWHGRCTITLRAVNRESRSDTGFVTVDFINVHDIFTRAMRWTSVEDSAISVWTDSLLYVRTDTLVCGWGDSAYHAEADSFIPRLRWIPTRILDAKHFYATWDSATHLLTLTPTHDDSVRGRVLLTAIDTKTGNIDTTSVEFWVDLVDDEQPDILWHNIELTIPENSYAIFPKEGTLRDSSHLADPDTRLEDIKIEFRNGRHSTATSLDSSCNRVKITPDPWWYGKDFLWVVAKDLGKGVDSARIILVVEAVNDTIATPITLVYPPDTANVEELKPAFLWTGGIDPDGSIVQYTVYITRDFLGTMVQDSTSTTEHSVTWPRALPRAHYLYWHVKAKTGDPNDAVRKSDTHRFTTFPVDSSGTLTPIHPNADGIAEFDRYGEFAVAKVNVNTSANLTYRVYLSLDPSFGDACTKDSSTPTISVRQDPTWLDWKNRKVPIYFRCAAFTDDNPGKIWWLRGNTRLKVAPSAPIILDPIPPDSIVRTPTIVRRWSASHDEDGPDTSISYRVRYGYDEPDESLWLKEPTRDTSIPFDDIPLSRHLVRWKVIAVDADSLTASSSVDSFAVAPFVTISPKDDTTLVPPVAFGWTPYALDANDFAYEYEVEIGSDHRFSAVLFRDTVLAKESEKDTVKYLFEPPAGLILRPIYWWHVKPFNVAIADSTPTGRFSLRFRPTRPEPIHDPRAYPIARTSTIVLSWKASQDKDTDSTEITYRGNYRVAKGDSTVVDAPFLRPYNDTSLAIGLPDTGWYDISWNVRAYADGDSSEELADSLSAYPFIALSPSRGVELDSMPPFHWSRYARTRYPEVFASGYEVVVATDIEFTDIIEKWEVPGCLSSFTPDTDYIHPSRLYYWKVIELDSNTATTSTSFVTMDKVRYRPAPPSLDPILPDRVVRSRKLLKLPWRAPLDRNKVPGLLYQVHLSEDGKDFAILPANGVWTPETHVIWQNPREKDGHDVSWYVVVQDTVVHLANSSKPDSLFIRLFEVIPVDYDSTSGNPPPYLRWKPYAWFDEDSGWVVYASTYRISIRRAFTAAGAIGEPFTPLDTSIPPDNPRQDVQWNWPSNLTLPGDGRYQWAVVPVRYDGAAADTLYGSFLIRSQNVWRNQPNPFTSSTTFVLDVMQRLGNRYEVAIFDQSGVIVTRKELAIEDGSEGRRASYLWEPSHLPLGLYAGVLVVDGRYRTELGVLKVLYVQPRR